MFVARIDQVEEKNCAIAADRQVADLIDDHKRKFQRKRANAVSFRSNVASHSDEAENRSPSIEIGGHDRSERPVAFKRNQRSDSPRMRISPYPPAHR